MSTTARFTGASNVDNTGRTLLMDYQSPAYASTIAIATDVNATNTLVQVAQLTGALTMTIGVGTLTTAPYVGDQVRILFSADGTNRVVTFGTGFVSSGTLTVTASKFASVLAIFNGTAWQVVGREITA